MNLDLYYKLQILKNLNHILEGKDRIVIPLDIVMNINIESSQSIFLHRWN